jgi:hypothetical protein
VTEIKKFNHSDGVEKLKEAIRMAPMSVLISVGTIFQAYKSGVINTLDCNEFNSDGSPLLNHAVSVVGYG